MRGAGVGVGMVSVVAGKLMTAMSRTRPVRPRIGVAVVLAIGALDMPTVASAQAGGQEVNAFAVAPRVGVLYDSNVFQLNDDRFSGDRSDTVLSPAIDLSFNRTIGRNSLAVNADLAYDLHRRFKALDQFNIAASGRGTLAVSAFCVASPTGSVSVQQNNRSGNGATKNSQANQVYAATLSCRRPFGLYPSISVSYQSVTNGQELLEAFDQHTLSVSGGIGYAVPTLGSVLLSVGGTRIRQPNRALLDGMEGGSNVVNAGLTIDRAVAPRLSFSASARYLSVKPLRASTQDFAGPGYNATVDFHPSRRVSVIASVSRDVTGSGDAAVSYVLSSSYGLTGAFTLSTLTSFNLSAQHFDRDYRGEDPIYFPVLRGSERGETFTASVSRSVGRRVQLSAFANYTRLDARSDFYDYRRFQLGVSAGARF